jgi:hypothetical protein
MDDKFTFNPSAVQAVLVSLARIAVLIVGSAATLIGIVRRADLNALYSYFGSSDFTAVLGAVATGVTLYFSLRTKWQERKALTKAEPFAPNLEAKP